jgi:DNA-directed RNA polymerase subunit RPC12/RpoP
MYKFKKEKMVHLETIGISFWGSGKDVSPRHYCEDGTLGLLSTKYRCLHCGENISEKDEHTLEVLENNYELELFYSYNTLNFSANDKFTSQFVFLDEADIMPITDKLVLTTATDHIFHFCNGYHIENGSVFYDKLGGVNKGYKCYKCNYPLNSEEKFLVKMLNFKENIRLYDYKD